ncbi:MAG: hypothetical protein KME11_01765 [Timaviella obliquedivisa GSE-PSE-MK23-08B]|jgi:hypothetical protein|nr:hypothetical protein [Timaviella obliquedivisa GSE-PSE-MK23-08B]
MTTEESPRLDRLEALAEALLQVAQQQQTRGIRHESDIDALKQSTETLLRVAHQQQTQGIRHEGEIGDLETIYG